MSSGDPNKLRRGCAFMQAGSIQPLEQEYINEFKAVKETLPIFSGHACQETQHIFLHNSSDFVECISNYNKMNDTVGRYLSYISLP